MRRPIAGLALPLALIPALSGCVVRTAASIATAPVRATGWTVDRLTTSQAEADRNRGRHMRKDEARQRREARRAAERQRRDAGGGGDKAM